MDEQAISFGPFRLLVAQWLRLDGNNPVRLGSRAFDLLTALVEHAGEVVSKEELIAPLGRNQSMRSSFHPNVQAG
jgi:DNA-binding winged helix-turn-helix (wHTH) protein